MSNNDILGLSENEKRPHDSILTKGKYANMNGHDDQAVDFWVPNVWTDLCIEMYGIHRNTQFKKGCQVYQ